MNIAYIEMRLYRIVKGLDSQVLNEKPGAVGQSSLDIGRSLFIFKRANYLKQVGFDENSLNSFSSYKVEANNFTHPVCPFIF